MPFIDVFFNDVIEEFSSIFPLFFTMLFCFLVYFVVTKFLLFFYYQEDFSLNFGMYKNKHKTSEEDNKEELE